MEASCFILSLSFADQQWTWGGHRIGAVPVHGGVARMKWGTVRRQLQAPGIFLFFNIGFCQNQNTGSDWYKDGSSKGRLQEKRHPFVIELFIGWKGYPGVQRTPTFLPPYTSLQGWCSRVPQLSQVWSDCCPQRLSRARFALALPLIPQPISCYFKPFSIYCLALLSPSRSHELVHTLDTVPTEPIIFWFLI